MDDLDFAVKRLSRFLGEVRSMISKINGISTPIGGISWDRVQTDMEILHNLMVFLEDRRALYTDYDREEPRYVDRSIEMIRSEITRLLQMNPSPKLSDHLEGLRKLCRDFYPSKDHYFRDLARFRELFGNQLDIMVEGYGIEIKGDLSKIISSR